MSKLNRKNAEQNAAAQQSAAAQNVVVAHADENVSINTQNAAAQSRAEQRRAAAEQRAAERAILRGAVSYKERVNVARENYAALKYSRIYSGFMNAQPILFQNACKHADFHEFCVYIDKRYKNGVKTYAEISNFYVSQYFQQHIKNAAQNAAHKDYAAARNYLVAERAALQNAKNA